MSNPLMQNNPNAGAWLNGQQEAPKSAPINSLYSDYGKTLAKTNVTPEIYGELARDWIEDDDAVKQKAAAYFKYVVAHD